MAFRPLSSRIAATSAFTDPMVSKKGSGAQVIVGLVVIIIGIGIRQAVPDHPITYILAAIGIGIIVSSFLMIIRQYESSNTEDRQVS